MEPWPAVDAEEVPPPADEEDDPPVPEPEADAPPGPALLENENPLPEVEEDAPPAPALLDVELPLPDVEADAPLPELDDVLVDPELPGVPCCFLGSGRLSLPLATTAGCAMGVQTTPGGRIHFSSGITAP